MTTYGLVDPDQSVVVDYTNHEGERRERQIVPFDLVWAATEHHPEAQWLLRAYDVEADGFRMFAMANVHQWKRRGE